MTLKEISQNHKQDDDKNIVINNKTVSIFYFRAGCSEKDFPDEVSLKITTPIGFLES